MILSFRACFVKYNRLRYASENETVSSECCHYHDHAFYHAPSRSNCYFIFYIVFNQQKSCAWGHTVPQILKIVLFLASAPFSLFLHILKSSRRKSSLSTGYALLRAHICFAMMVPRQRDSLKKQNFFIFICTTYLQLLASRIVIILLVLDRYELTFYSYVQCLN